jgi:hypothetical protein
MNQSRLALALLLLSGTATAKTWSSVDDDLARKISKAHALRPSEPAPGVPTSVELGPDQVVEGREDESTVSYQTVRSNIDYESTIVLSFFFTGPTPLSGPSICFAASGRAPMEGPAAARRYLDGDLRCLALWGLVRSEKLRLHHWH